MDDVVAVIVTDGKRGEVGFLSWGRVFDPVDPTELANAIRAAVRRFGLNDVTDVRVCGRLGDASDFEYFFEGLLSFAAKMAQQPVRDDDLRMKSRDPEAFTRSIYGIGRRVT